MFAGQVSSVKAGVAAFHDRIGLSWPAILLAFAPTLLFVPAILEPLPMMYYGGRETAFYFISHSIIEMNVRSWLVLTIYESWSSPHLYSLLSVPLVAIGFVEGGRLVSLTCAGVAALAVGYITKHVAGPRGAVIGIGLFWLHPFVVRQSYLYQPEAMSIAFTTGAVALTIAYVRSACEERILFVLLSVLFVAPLVHTWEASVGLPVVAYLGAHRRFHDAVLSAVATGTGVVVSNAMVQLQPGGQTQLSGVSVLATGLEIFTDPAWWLLPPGEAMGTVGISMTVTLVGAVLAMPVLVYVVIRRQDADILLLCSWLVSGLVIIFLLPRGPVRHVYYAWAIVSPMIVLTSVVVSKLLRDADTSALTTDRKVAVVFLLLITVYAAGVTYGVGGVYEGAPVQHADRWGVDADEARQAGIELRSAGVTSPDQIAFVGDWGFNTTEEVVGTGGTPVLVYSGVMLDYRTAKVAHQKGDPLPETVPNQTVVENATHCVILEEDRSMTVGRCAQHN